MSNTTSHVTRAEAELLRNTEPVARNTGNVALGCALPLPAYAYAYASVPPTRERCTGGTRTAPTPQEWAYLLAEREGILLDGGMPEPLARAAAFQDTVRFHGPRPMAGSRGAEAPRIVRTHGGAL